MVAVAKAGSVGVVAEEVGYVVGPLKWAIAFTAALGAALEIIDTSIVNVALTDIQASLGATVSEVGWVVTGYAIANVILIPLSAWLSDRFGRKSYFIFSLIGFTLASFMCGLAASLPMLIFSRILQGLCGGGLLAKGQTIMYETFPPAEQGMAQGLFGIGVIMGPAIGPTLGGYLTDTFGWRSIFFINLPLGLIAVLMAWWFLRPDPSIRPQNPIDVWGILLLAATAGGLQTVLEEGQQNSWFESGFIVSLAVITVVGFVLFVWRELTTEYPAVNLRVLRYRSLAAGSLFFGVLGMGLYGTIFVVPIFAQSILRFTATQTGWLLAPGAFASAVMMIFLSRLVRKIDPRYVIAVGAIGLSVVMFSLANITPQTGQGDLYWPLMFRGIFTTMMFLPLTIATLGSLPREAIADGSGFSNLARQLGGSLGIALLTTVLQQREAFHHAVLAAKVTAYDPATMQRLDQLSNNLQAKGMDLARAGQQTLAVIENLIQIQAAVLSFADLFRIVGILFIASLLLLPLLAKGGKGSAPAAH